MIGHVVDGYISGGKYLSSVASEYGIYQVIYTFHMPLFFLISGFMFSLAYVDMGGKVKTQKLKTQLLDIVVVYVVFSALMVSFKVFCSSVVNTQASFDELLSIGWKPVAVYWYLYVLALFYIVHILLVKCDKEILLAVGLFCLSACATFLPFSHIFFLYQFVFCLPFFFLGVVFHRDVCSPNWKLACLGLVASCTLLFLFWNHSTTSYDDFVHRLPVVNTLVALGFCIFFWKAFSSVKWLDNKALETCGRYCLEIYVTHCFLTAGFRAVFVALGVTNFWLSLILNTILSTALPILFAMALERIGLHDLLFRPVHYIMRLKEGRARA